MEDYVDAVIRFLLDDDLFPIEGEETEDVD